MELPVEQQPIGPPSTFVAVLPLVLVIALSTLGDTYFAMAAMVMPFVSLVVLIILGTLFGSF